jgi:hypothetical protein
MPRYPEIAVDTVVTIRVQRAAIGREHVAAPTNAALVKNLPTRGRPRMTQSGHRTSFITFLLRIAAAQKGDRYPVRLRNAELASPGTEAEMN